MYHLNPRNRLCKDQPDINLRVFRELQIKMQLKYKLQMKISKTNRNTDSTNHFDIGRLRKGARDADEEGGEDEEGGQVHRNNRLKEEPAENQNWP